MEAEVVAGGEMIVDVVVGAEKGIIRLDVVEMAEDADLDAVLFEDLGGARGL